jgi:homoserine kinase
MNRRTSGDFVVSAPASSANLGSGFDAVGIAIEIRMTARVSERAPGEPARWTYGGSHAPTHDGVRACIEAGIARIAPAAPPLAVELENAIPLGAGLGSSAAAYAIGVAIGAHLRDDPPGDDALAHAVAELEGHPDNALAAWYGGTIVAAMGDDGLTSIRLPAPDVAAVVVVPDFTLTTVRARALLPRSYDRDDTVHNIQRAALLGAALAAGRLDLLRAAVRDRLHQPYRAHAIPGLAQILALDEPALLAIALSGAGPSVIALVRRDAQRIGATIAAMFAQQGIEAAILTPALATHGVDLALAERA